MEFPRVRLTVRRWAVLLVALAVGFAWIVTYRNHVLATRMASHHLAQANVILNRAWSLKETDPEGFEREIALYNREMALAARFGRATLFPP